MSTSEQHESVLNDIVTSQTILLRHRESKKIARLPATPETPRVVMLVHAGDLDFMKNEMMKAADSGKPDEIAKAVRMYAQWRFVSDNWVHDMESMIERCGRQEDGS